MATAAAQFAAWIENEHPALYQTLLGYVAQQRARVRLRRASLQGFGDDGDIGVTTTFDDSGGDFTPDFSSDDFSAGSSDSSLDNPLANFTPDLQDVGSSTDILSSIGDSSVGSGSDVSNSLATTTDNSGSSFLDSLSSGVQSAASGIASFLTSPSGLKAVTGLATAYFQVQNTKANAAVQTQILQAQAARAASGASPYPITYVQGANGQLVPVYSTAGLPMAALPAALQQAIASGQAQLVNTDGVAGYTIPSNILPSLGASTDLSSLMPWVLLIVGGLLLAKALK